MRLESEGVNGLMDEAAYLLVGLVLFVFGVCSGWAIGYVQGCHKRGDYTK